MNLTNTFLITNNWIEIVNLVFRSHSCLFSIRFDISLVLSTNTESEQQAYHDWCQSKKLEEHINRMRIYCSDSILILYLDRWDKEFNIVKKMQIVLVVHLSVNCVEHFRIMGWEQCAFYHLFLCIPTLKQNTHNHGYHIQQ